MEASQTMTNPNALTPAELADMRKSIDRVPSLPMAGTITSLLDHIDAMREVMNEAPVGGIGGYIDPDEYRLWREKLRPFLEQDG